MNIRENRIEEKAVRIEFEGHFSPKRLVVPLILSSGKHKNLRIRIVPRDGVAFAHAVELGDALQSNFTHSHSFSGGASFFASAKYQRTFGQAIYQEEPVQQFSISFTRV